MSELFSVQTLLLRVRLRTSSEPPLGSRLSPGCAAELSVDVIIITKVVFFMRRALLHQTGRNYKWVSCQCVESSNDPARSVP